MLVAVVLAILAVNLFDLTESGVKVVGPLPEGFPPFTIPTVPVSDLLLLFAGALGIALVSLTDTISTASAFAARSGDQVDGNKEMIGIGAANIAAGFFQGFPISTSGSRTAVAAQNGAKSQVTGLVGAAAILLLLVFAPGLLKNLPQPTLAAVVIAASLSLADFSGMRRLWRQRRSDFWLAMTAFLGVALLGVLPGIGLAVAMSILDVFSRVWRPYEAVLGRVPGMAGYHDSRVNPTAAYLPGLVIYRFDGPLFFANANTFRDKVLAAGRVRTPADLDPGGRGTDDRCRHHRGGHARRPRPEAERRRDQPGLRRDEDAGPGEGRAVRTDRRHRARALLRHHRGGGAGLPGPDRRHLGDRGGFPLALSRGPDLPAAGQPSNANAASVSCSNRATNSPAGNARASGPPCPARNGGSVRNSLGSG